ncbi:hypothetical protein TWF481_011825 [Arthrobotrys musiformis]|uniref:Uncharacterized protein n=1 Tax=Arthrobotrys musiformis TaxID=47236 RepID=A0AAV9VV69_9PEZI
MSLPLPPVKRRRTGSESSYSPDPNEAEDASSVVSGEGRVFVETIITPTPRTPRKRRARATFGYRSRRSYRTTGPTPKLQQSDEPIPRPSRSRSGGVKIILKTNSKAPPLEVPSTPPPAPDILNLGNPLGISATTLSPRKFRKRNTVRDGTLTQFQQTSEIRYDAMEAHTSRSARSSNCHQGREGTYQRSKSRSVIRSPPPASKAQERIAELEKENTVLEEENCTLRAQVDELCSRIGDVASNSFETAIFKDDVFFENGFINLNKMVRDFVREFLQSKFTSPLSPSRVPTKIKDVLDSESTEWQKYVRGGKNRKVLRAIAQKYISFYLIENIVGDPIFRQNRQLQNAFSTVQAAFKGDYAASNRWRNRTIQELRSTRPEQLSDDFMVDQKSKELFKDTRVLWIKNHEVKQTDRLRKILEYAVKIAVELHKLPYEIQYGFSRHGWDKLPRDIDTHPENEFYQIHVQHSRHSSFQFMTVFPGIRKLSGISDTGEDGDSGFVYLPLQLSAYD